MSQCFSLTWDVVQEERGKPDDGRNCAACPVEQGSDLQKIDPDDSGPCSDCLTVVMSRSGPCSVCTAGGGVGQDGCVEPDSSSFDCHI